MKKLTRLLLIALGTASVLGAAGCATTTTASVATNANWYLSTGFSGIQLTSIEGNEGFCAEELKYSVSLKDDSSTNEYYSVVYDEGSFYTTKFYGVNFDWQGDKVLDEYKTQKTEAVYAFETTLSVSGKYLHKDGGEVAFEDTVSTVCYFKSTAKNLAPVYSQQIMHSTSPASNKPESAEQMTKKYDYSCTTYYDEACANATVIYDDLNGDGDKTFTVNNLDQTLYSLFDNASVIIAMRSLDTNAESFAKLISTFIPVENGASTYGISKASSGTLGEGDEGIKNALVEAGYVTADAEVAFNRLNTALQEDMQGGTRSYWYASVSDQSANLCRSTLLKMATPLSFGLGTLEYELEEVVSVLGAGV